MSTDPDRPGSRAVTPPRDCEEEGGRQKKRHRSDDRNDGRDDGAAAPPPLPDYVWAIALNFLPYESVLRCACVSKSMLRDVMPLVSELHIQSPAQLRAGAIAERYRDARDVYVYSLVGHDAPGYAQRLDEDTALRAVPFLSSFPRLERAFLGGTLPDEAGGSAEGYDPALCPGEGNDEVMAALIRALSGAFRAGALSEKLHVMGLRCPRSGSEDDDNGAMNRFLGEELPCPACIEACRSFPLGEVVDFECNDRGGAAASYRGSRAVAVRFGYNRYGHCGTDLLRGLDVCLGKDRVEEIVRERKGGEELLASEARLFELLGRGTRYVVITERRRWSSSTAGCPDDDDDDDIELYVVRYTEAELGDIRRCIANSRIDARRLSQEKVTRAIWRSFAPDDDEGRGLLPPRERCHLAERSFVELREGVGLPIDEADFLNGGEWDGRRRRAHPHLYDWRFT